MEYIEFFIILLHSALKKIFFLFLSFHSTSSVLPKEANSGEKKNTYTFIFVINVTILF